MGGFLLCGEKNVVCCVCAEPVLLRKQENSEVRRCSWKTTVFLFHKTGGFAFFHISPKRANDKTDKCRWKINEAFFSKGQRVDNMIESIFKRGELIKRDERTDQKSPDQCAFKAFIIFDKASKHVQRNQDNANGVNHFQNRHT